MPEDITKSPYAEWLEGLIKSVMEHGPVSIGVVMLLPDNTGTLTAYYNSDCQDKAVMAHNIYSDSIYDMIKVNAKDFKRFAEEQDDEDEECDDGGDD